MIELLESRRDLILTSWSTSLTFRFTHSFYLSVLITNQIIVGSWVNCFVFCSSNCRLIRDRKCWNSPSRLDGNDELIAEPKPSPNLSPCTDFGHLFTVDWTYCWNSGDDASYICVWACDWALENFKTFIYGWFCFMFSLLIVWENLRPFLLLAPLFSCSH